MILEVEVVVGDNGVVEVGKLSLNTVFRGGGGGMSASSESTGGGDLLSLGGGGDDEGLPKLLLLALSYASIRPGETVPYIFSLLNRPVLVILGESPAVVSNGGVD